MNTTPQSTQPAAPQEGVPSSMLTLTARAVQQVKDVSRQQGFESYYLTVRVVPAGCSGLGYDLNLVPETKAGDLVWEQDGVKMATDKLSSQYLSGTEVDYVTSVQGAGFKFSNPNAKSSCGCGTSFTT
ncbi:MAG: iron-sulfur cluster assembly accessory protein [Myxococcaceae bacterium]|nr:iron-sulfur cluster assembly accessory protein [Myxococcaceae bacterium]MCI0672303.1 iron-sulfur cluster assembly accessory protein [Myxococcaceae bacterium]